MRRQHRRPRASPRRLRDTGIAIRLDAGTIFSVLRLYTALGNAVALTDMSRNLVGHYIYDVFGAPTVLNASSTSMGVSALGNRFLFTGRECMTRNVWETIDLKSAAWLGPVGLPNPKLPPRFNGRSRAGAAFAN